MANYRELGAKIPSSSRATHHPFIDVPDIHNFRGLSDMVGKNGRRVRPAYVFRSAEPSQCNSDGQAKMAELGITHVYDLRSASEIERFQQDMPITEIPGTTRVFTPVFPPADPDMHKRRMGYYGEIGSAGFVAAYAEILVIGKNAYRTVFTHIRDRPDAGLLVHCSAGKDRTGVCVALIGDLVGVPAERISEEYSLTEIGLAPWVPAIMEAMMKDPALGHDPERITRALSAKKENMLAFLDKMYGDWGNAEGYLTKGLGFSEEDVAKIRNNVSEPVS